MSLATLRLIHDNEKNTLIEEIINNKINEILDKMNAIGEKHPELDVAQYPKEDLMKMWIGILELLPVLSWVKGLSCTLDKMIDVFLLKEGSSPLIEPKCKL